jgi:Rieske Fe-S protein
MRLRNDALPRRRISRRTAFVSGISALAAGVLGGLGIDRFIRSDSSNPTTPAYNGGKWFAVAQTAEVPEGAVRPFTAGEIKGFLINSKGNYRALSRICTHMGCVLKFNSEGQAFVCPCHGARFGMQGQYVSGPPRYTYPLRPLPPIEVRQNGDTIEVRGA